MLLNYVFFSVSVFLVRAKNIPPNNTAIITEYAKVARWGSQSASTQKPQAEGRSNGQSLWTHRSDVRIYSGQNLKTAKPSVVYHYAVHKPSSKVGEDKTEVLPAVGEVQERFNPRPYFDYAHVPGRFEGIKNKPAPQAPPAPSPSAKPSVVYHYAVHKPSSKVGEDKTEVLPAVGEVQERFNPRPYFDYAHVPGRFEGIKNKPAPQAPPAPSPSAPTFDSFPVFNKPPEASKNPPVDLYTSPYSSYNPPKSPPSSDTGDSVAYPPNAPPPPGDTGTVDAPPPSNSDSDKDYPFEPPKDDGADTDSMPPEEPPKPSYPSLGPPLAPHDDHPPPQKDEQLFYPPSDNGMHQEVILDHPPPGYEENGKGNGHDMAEQDLAPPPSPDTDARFPQYLYSDPHGHDFHAYPYEDHHVYKEITTTTEAAEDERVNKGQYSYYYLGRKLWYIPLYFSVYFIIYVTVLILKSIARHKIQFKHHFHYDDREARQLSPDEKIDEIHQNVTTAIDTSRKKFAYVAM